MKTYYTKKAMEITGMKANTVFFFIEKGLFKPYKKAFGTGYRSIYSEDDLKKLSVGNETLVVRRFSFLYTFLKTIHFFGSIFIRPFLKPNH